MERDDLIVNDSYALNAHHSEEEGVAIRKKIYMVTVICPSSRPSRWAWG